MWTCRGGHKVLVDLMIDKVVHNLEDRLCGACLSAKKEFVDLMISKRTKYWDHGLKAACNGGHINIDKFLISGREFMGWGFMVGMLRR